MSGSGLVATPSGLSGSLRSFLYSSSVYSYSFHLFLVSSSSIISLSFLSFIISIFGWNVPLLFPILLEISSLSPSVVFLLLLCIVHWRRPSCLCLLVSGTLCLIGYTFPFLPCFSLLLFSQLLLRTPQATSFTSHICFSWGWFCWPPPVQCYKLLSIVPQASRPNPLNLFFISAIKS